MKKRLLGILLILSAALPVLMTGCGAEPAGDAGTPSVPAAETTAAASAETTAEPVTEELPDVPDDADFDGYDFRVIARGTGKWTCQDMYAAEATGEVLNDTVLERNQYVEEMLHYSLSMQLADSDSALYNTISKTILAGEDAYDLLWVNSENIAKLSMKGLLADIAAIDTLDLSHSWWDQKAVGSLCIDGHIYFTTGNISIMGNYATYVISFNKTLHEEYGLDDLYEIVRRGAWDFDCFEKMTKSISSDLNGDGEYDEHDLFGFMTYNSDYSGFLLSAGGSYAKIDGDSILTNYNTEPVLKTLERLADLHTDRSTYFFRSDDTANVIFVEGRTLFCFRTLINLNFYRDMETDYGILPTPKADETQDDYHCGVHAYGLSLIGAPVTSPDLSRTGLIIDCLGWKSKELLTPVFYEKTLKGKYFRDDESGEMLDIVFSSRVYDIGYFGDWGGLSSKLSSMSAADQGDFASVFASYEAPVNKSLTETIEAYNAIR